MNETTTELLFMGLPETGKTTFILALDEVIQRQSDKHGLVSNGFADNRSYIESLKKRWRSGKSLERTKLTTKGKMELLVRHTKTNNSISLTAPDVEGEIFDDQWADRQWTVSYRERLSSLAGIFLFIKASTRGTNTEISQAWINHQDAPPAAQSIPWTARAAAKQVKLVELLQFIAERGQIRKPLPLAVMLSAWDLVDMKDAPKLRPEKFLESEWSLLHQYLQANPEIFSSRIFGVSARGGDDEAQVALASLAPHERVWLKDGNEVTKDFTRPLRWLLRLD